MKIGRAKESDACQLVTLMSQIASESSFLLYEPDEVPSSTWLKKRLSTLRQSEYIWVAETNHKFVGYIALTLGVMKRNRGVGTLAMGVISDYSGKGVGSELLIKVIKEAQKMEVYRLQLQVQTNNERAIRLYRKFDFEIEGVLRSVAKVEGNLIDKFMMAKLL